MSLLRLDNVSLMRGGRMLFEQLDVTIQPSNAVQIVGPNGVGKSSLLRLVAGLLRPSAGRVERSTFAFADDHAALDRELPLERALRFWWRDGQPALEAMGIGHLPDVPVRLLSSGQLKRATLARVIASGAPLWLLDEPLNALDAEGAERLTEAIARHRSAGGAVLAASHPPMGSDWRRLELGR